MQARAVDGAKNMTEFDFSHLEGHELLSDSPASGLSREDVAYHESGHAVAMVTFEIEFQEIAIFVYEENGESKVRGETIRDLQKSVAIPQELAAAMHCGILAATKYQNPEVNSKNLAQFFTESLKLGAGTDLARAASIRKELEQYGLFDELEFENDISEVIDGRWSAICAVAERLLVEGKLSGDRVKEIMQENPARSF
jgi:hypothetical protein